jgi:hypothetical protein
MRFVNGVFDTDDERITKLLIDWGYKHDGQEEANRDGEETQEVQEEIKPQNVSPQKVEVLDEVSADVGVKELREIGRQHGLAFKPGTTKIDMAKAINAK